MESKKFYESVGKKMGWDFSDLTSRTIVKNKKWNFYQEVAKFLDKDKILLDIGTGSGEKLFDLSVKCKKIVGIDNSKVMIEKANEKLATIRVKNIEFKFADANRLPFKTGEFDVVSCRHSPFNMKKIFGVLRTNGIFITQQVGERDKQNIKNVFGRGQSYKKKDGSLINRYCGQAEKLGFKILRKDHYCATEYYKSSDLVFLFENTSIIPNFNKERDHKFLEELIKKFNTKYGIKTNSCRYLLVLKKLT